MKLLQKVVPFFILPLFFTYQAGIYFLKSTCNTSSAYSEQVA